jgi:hypothetical protein
MSAADPLNDRVVPFFDSHGIPLARVLTDRGTKYCGNPEHHEYELYLAVENIDHTRTKARSPPTNGIVERLHESMLNEFYRIAFRKKITTRSPPRRPIWTAGLTSTAMSANIRDDGATARRQCVPFSIPSNSPGRN